MTRHISTPFVPETDIITTTPVYANPPPQNDPVPDLTPTPQNGPVPIMTPPPQNTPLPDPTPSLGPVTLVLDTTSPTTITHTVVAGFHGVKWYDYKDEIDLDELPSLHWKFTNQFGDAVYPNSGVWVSRLDAWLMMYEKKLLLISFTRPSWYFSVKAGIH